MKHIKFKTIMLGSMLAISGALGLNSCDNSKDSDETETPKKQKTTLVASNDSTHIINKNEYYNHVFDSIKSVNGADYYAKRANSMIYNSKRGIKDIKLAHSLSQNISREVRENGVAILDVFYSDLLFVTNKLNINLKDHITKTKDGFKTKDGQLFDFDSMCLTGVLDEIEQDSTSQGQDTFDLFYIHVNTVMDSLNCVELDSVKPVVSGIMNQTKRCLISSRKYIENKYSDYYIDFSPYNWVAVYDNKFYPEFPKKEIYGFDYSGKYNITYDYFEFCDTALNANFFADKNAKYSINALGDNNWQITKKLQNEQSEQTPVFHHAVQSEPLSIKTDSLKCNSFNYEINANDQVCVYFTNAVEIVQRKKNWTSPLSSRERYAMDSLNTQIAKSKEILNISLQKCQEADSIATIMVKNRFETPER